MIFWSLPKLLEFSGGLAVFDMRPTGYSFTEALNLLKSLDGEGISFYRNVQLPLDLFYPLGFILTYSTGCLWAFNKIGKWKLAGYVGAVCAVLAGMSDYVENFMIWKMLNYFPQITEDLVASSSLATLAKSISTTIAMSIFMLGFLVIGINKLSNKHRK